MRATTTPPGGRTTRTRNSTATWSGSASPVGCSLGSAGQQCGVPLPGGSSIVEDATARLQRRIAFIYTRRWRLPPEGEGFDNGLVAAERLAWRAGAQRGLARGLLELAGAVRAGAARGGGVDWQRGRRGDAHGCRRRRGDRRRLRARPGRPGPAHRVPP